MIIVCPDRLHFAIILFDTDYGGSLLFGTQPFQDMDCF